MRILYLIRGLPGSGKTSFAEDLTTWNVATDDFFHGASSGENTFWADPKMPTLFRMEREYKFIPSKIGEAHKWCQNQVEYWMDRNKTGYVGYGEDDQVGAEKIAVHNTFTREWEMEPYFKLAEKYGYRVVVLTVENTHGGEPTKDIPKEAIERMARRWEVMDPRLAEYLND